MSNQTFAEPSAPPPLYPDMPEPPPKYEETEGYPKKEGYNNKGRHMNQGQAENLQHQNAIIMVANGQAQQAFNQQTGDTLVVTPIFGKKSMPFICQNCMGPVMTTTKPKAGKLTYLMCCLMCCFITPILAWIPCCVKSCQDVDHHCPSCEAHIGTFKRM